MELYDFRYKLDDDITSKDFKTLEDFYQDMIESILEVVEFTNLNSVVEVDGFKFINKQDIIQLFINKNVNI